VVEVPEQAADVLGVDGVEHLFYLQWFFNVEYVDWDLFLNRLARELGFNTLKLFSSHTVAIQYQHTPKKTLKNNENTKTTPKTKSPRNHRHTGEGIQA
jgi:hypothetical protein